MTVFLEQSLRPLGPEHIGEYVQREKLQLSEETILVLYHLTDGIPNRVSTEIGTLKLKLGQAGG